MGRILLVSVLCTAGTFAIPFVKDSVSINGLITSDQCDVYYRYS